MKTITSFGGPFIALESQSASEWSGVFGKRFVGESSSFANDYTAACEATYGDSSPTSNCAIIENGSSVGIVIAPPVETLVISHQDAQVLIIQIESAEEGFSLDELEQCDFDGASYPSERDVSFSTSGGSFVLFDSSAQILELEGNYLQFDLPQGDYTISNCEFVQDSLAELNLFRLYRSK